MVICIIWMRVGVKLLLLLLRVPCSVFRLLLFPLALHHGPLVVWNASMIHDAYHDWQCMSDGNAGLASGLATQVGNPSRQPKSPHTHVTRVGAHRTHGSGTAQSCQGSAWDALGERERQAACDKRCGTSVPRCCVEQDAV